MGKLVLHRRAKRAQPEQQLHKAVADYLQLALRPPTIWTTIGHGGGGKARGGQLKAMGVQPGWPDLLVLSPYNNFCNVIGIELKAKAGKQSPEQHAVGTAFYGCHGWYILCRSVDEVEKALRFCKVPLHASVMGSGIRVAA